jgi:hypothetical protein
MILSTTSLILYHNSHVLFNLVLEKMNLSSRKRLNGFVLSTFPTAILPICRFPNLLISHFANWPNSRSLKQPKTTLLQLISAHSIIALNLSEGSSSSKTNPIISPTSSTAVSVSNLQYSAQSSS